MTTAIAYTQTRWSLTDLFPGPDSPELELAFDVLDAQTSEFEESRAQLTPDIDSAAFLGVIRELETLTEQLYRLYGFAGLWFTEDTQNQAAQSLQARIDRFVAQLTNRTLFFSLWWKALEDDNAERLMADAGDYRYWLEKMRHFREHTLSEARGKNHQYQRRDRGHAFVTLYDAITNRYVFKIEVDGEMQELTRGELMVHVRSADPDLRAAAYRELYRVYREQAPILGQIYQNIVRDWHNEQIDLRHFSTPIAVRNRTNDIPDEVVDLLLDVARANATLFQRYFRLKARWLGVEQLRRYDVYAPINSSGTTFDYNTAANMVFDAFNEFDPRIAELAQLVFDEERIDSEVRQGKRTGAFCWGISPSLTPWVMLNYQGKAEDVSTMAHELGHAIHSMLASDHSIFTFHASLPLAETASTFGEMLLVDRLLAEEQDEEVRRDILFKQIDDNYATIMRQIFFALFEKEAHELINQGASVDDLSEAYLNNLRDQFGDSLELDEEFRWEWVAIPHIYHSPFYVYAYAFGQLLVLSLYQQYKEEGATFIPRYMDILSAGGSEAPARVLCDAGIDIHSRDFWQGGFDILAALLDQLEAIPVPSDAT